jgi:hypothetical protein
MQRRELALQEKFLRKDMFKMKKLTALLLAVMLVMGNVQVFATGFPQSIWAPLSEFENMTASGNDSGIVSVGKTLVDIMEAEPESNIKTEFLSGKYYVIAQSAEKLGMYDLAAEYFEKYIPYGIQMGFDDGVKYARRKTVVLKPRLKAFFKDSSYTGVYYGAKYEPRSGVLFGSVYDNDPRIGSYDEGVIKQYFPKENSVNLVYLEFGEDITSLGRYAKYFDEIKRSGAMVLFAWNTYSSLGDIENYADYVKKTIDYLGNSGLKIILRFANEMNVGPNGENPEGYKKSFRYVADYAHTKSNIAMMWAPNDVGALDRDFGDYYPGDGYVDWVGVSHYTNKYFQGIKNADAVQENIDNTYFLCGEYSHPVLKLEPVVDFMKENNINKPLAISECGAPYYISSTGEDCSVWGEHKLRQIYGELARVYPQLKMICYFNVNTGNEKQLYALHGSNVLYNSYNDAVADDIFITDISAGSGFAYREFGGEFDKGKAAELSASAYHPAHEYGIVSYHIDGKWKGQSDKPPYKVNVEFEDLSEGAHTLTVKYLNKTGEMLTEKNYSFNVTDEIEVFLNGSLVEFKDRKPVVINERTLVPVRGIFEKMGMKVDWIDEEKKVVIQGNGYKIQLVIGDNKIQIEKNGASEVKMMEVSADTIDGRTMVPLRAISEAADAYVEWVPDTTSVEITVNW